MEYEVTIGAILQTDWLCPFSGEFHLRGFKTQNKTDKRHVFTDQRRKRLFGCQVHYASIRHTCRRLQLNQFTLKFVQLSFVFDLTRSDLQNCCPYRYKAKV